MVTRWHHPLVINSRRYESSYFYTQLYFRFIVETTEYTYSHWILQYAKMSMLYNLTRFHLSASLASSASGRPPPLFHFCHIVFDGISGHCAIMWFSQMVVFDKKECYASYVTVIDLGTRLWWIFLFCDQTAKVYDNTSNTTDCMLVLRALVSTVFSDAC